MSVPKKVWGKDPWEHKPVPSRLLAKEQREKEEQQKQRQREQQALLKKEAAAPDVITDAEFEEMVESAIERIPAELAEAVENCAFIIEKEPPKGQPGLLGLYRGHPLTSRSYYAGTLPDTITIYQGSLMRLYPKREALAHQVYRTVVHEVGHYFGFEEDELHELGWG